ncbi:MAG TPA: beta-propeller fold lactonase family protein [Solirubrobacterales bacterium]|nr:beta-propeller fold lactonase family protein [Solirubrobacterales bacterium]
MADVTRSARLPLVLAALVALAALLPAGASAAKPGPGTLTQLQGKKGCIVDRSSKPGTCASGRGLKGPGPFMGSRAVAVSPDGRNVYVASATSNAIAIFQRDPKSGALTQPKGVSGCVAVGGKEGCRKVAAFNGPNSVAVSPDGRNVYATARNSSTLLSFTRNPKTGYLRPIPGFACSAGVAIPACTPANGLVGPDVVIVSPDGRNVYAGAFFGSAVVAFSRDPSTGVLTQLAGTAGCIAAATAGCTTAIGISSIEGLAISGDGANVYAAAAASNALTELARDPSTGALSQLPAPNSCIYNAPITGCTAGRELGGPNAVAVAPGGENVYVTSFLSNSVTAFDRTPGSGVLAQKEATNACLIFLRSAGCSFGRAMDAPEGLDVSPDGQNIYIASIQTGAIDVLSRNGKGAIRQLAGTAGCVARKQVQGCTLGRAVSGVSSVAVSPDGRNVYATANESNAIDVFRRNR